MTAPANDLDALAIQHGSDKFGSHWYTENYDFYFAPIRGQAVHVLEIGIGGYDVPDQGGASLRMWRDYFPSGQIYGLDWYPKPGVAEDRIRTYQGSQADPVAIARIIEDVPARAFDIIIDDGSHRGEHVVATFMMLFQYVVEGGWYVIEDTQTAFWSGFGGSSNGLSGATATNIFFKALIDGLNWQEVHRPNYVPNYTDTNISGMHFHHNMIFIRKGRNDAASNHVVANRIPGQS